MEKPQASACLVAQPSAYPTGLQAAEVRPFFKSGITAAGVQLVATKRKRAGDVYDFAAHASPATTHIAITTLARTNGKRH